MIRSVSAILVRLTVLLTLLSGPPLLAGDGARHDCCANAMPADATGLGDSHASDCGTSHCTVCAAMIIDIDRAPGTGYGGAARSALKPTPPVGRAHDAPPAPPPRRA